MPRKEATLEDVFKNSALWSSEDGLISSIAWSEAGIDDFFNDKLDPNKVLAVMRKSSQPCNDAINPYTFLCSSGLDDELYFAINFIDSLDMESCLDCFFSEEEFKQITPSFESVLVNQLSKDINPKLIKGCIDEVSSKYPLYDKVNLNLDIQSLQGLSQLKILENLPNNCTETEKVRKGSALEIICRMYSKKNLKGFFLIINHFNTP